MSSATNQIKRIDKLCETKYYTSTYVVEMSRHSEHPQRMLASFSAMKLFFV